MKPIELNNDPQFFLDDRFIAESEGIVLEVNPATKAGRVLTPERPWEAFRITSDVVLEDNGLYKMWYSAIAHYQGKQGMVPCPRCRLENSGNKVVCVKCGWPLLEIDGMSKNLFHKCFAVSTDGIHWERPDLGLVEYEGNTRNNIFECTGAMGVPAINPLGPPEEKFMAISEYQGQLYISVSPDGLRWTMKPKPVLPFSADTNNQVIYDPVLGKYVAFLRGFPGRRTTARCEFDSLDEAPWPYQHIPRQPDNTGTTYIADELEKVMDVDENDPKLPGLDINHLSANIYRPGVYLGFPGIFRKYPPAGLDRIGRENHRYFAQGNDGTFETQLAVSRNGRQWTRPDRRPYVANGPFGSPDGGLIMVVPGWIERDHEIYQYYNGLRTTHGIFDPGVDRQVGSIFRLIQSKDRFISASAGSKGGRFVTPPLVHQGKTLDLNIDCGGLWETSAQILDEGGNPIKGFTQADCDRVDLNPLCHSMTWRGQSNLGQTAGKPIRLEFFMHASKLFTFQLAREHKGAG
ncbi:MAG: hypothetical protein NT011_03055 [Kiritimatiellaeota bacterium]|nr:hypothetical protein [Kiritimatiellota bacterium]